MSQKQKPQNQQKAIYTTEYKAEAVKLAVEAPSVAQAARNLGISEKTLYGWVAAQKTASATGTTVEAQKAAHSELAKLRRENARLRQERDFSYGPFLSRGPKTSLTLSGALALFRRSVSHRIRYAANRLTIDDGSSSTSRAG